MTKQGGSHFFLILYTLRLYIVNLTFSKIVKHRVTGTLNLNLESIDQGNSLITLESVLPVSVLKNDFSRRTI